MEWQILVSSFCLHCMVTAFHSWYTDPNVGSGGRGTLNFICRHQGYITLDHVYSVSGFASSVAARRRMLGLTHTLLYRRTLILSCLSITLCSENVNNAPDTLSPLSLFWYTDFWCRDKSRASSSSASCLVTWPRDGYIDVSAVFTVNHLRQYKAYTELFGSLC